MHVRITASDTSDQRTTFVVGTGSAVRPVTLCLSALGPGETDPTITPPTTV